MHYQTLIQTCASCGKQANESTKQYADRIRNGFNTRFNCRFCKRIFRAVTDPDHTKWLEQRRHERDVRTKLRQKEREARKRFEQEERQKINDLKKRLSLCDDFQRQIEAFDEDTKRKQRAVNGIRNKRLRIAMAEICEEEKIAIKQFYANTPEGYHVDHIIPLSKGGKHILKNLRYATGRENCEKGSKIIPKLIKRLAKGESLSIPWLQCNLKLKYEDAQAIMSRL